MANVGDGPRAAFAAVQRHSRNWQEFVDTLRNAGWQIPDDRSGAELAQQVLMLLDDDSRFPADWPPMDDLDDHNFEPGDHR